jgi:hypothetical protein
MERTDLKKKANSYNTISRGYGSLKRRRAKMYEGAAEAYERLAAEAPSTRKTQGSRSNTAAEKR